MGHKNKKYKIVYVQGMTCVSCEQIISDEVLAVEGVSAVNVCHKKQQATVHFSDQPDWDNVLNVIKIAGYSASLTAGEPIVIKKKATASQWFLSIAIVFALVLIFRYFNKLGIFSSVQGSVGMGLALLLGVVASMSTCLAVVGAVIISFGAKYQATGTFYQANVKPHLLFHFGRLTTFFVLGGLLGLLGGLINISTGFIMVFTLLIAVVLGWLGLNILGILPSFSTIVSMPKSSFSYWGKLKKSEHPLAPILLGGFTFFLPCGFTQSMQFFAISSGSFWVGGITLLLFALGTLPVLFGLGIATSKFKNMKSVVFEKAIGLLVILFAFYTMSTGLALAGISVDVFTSAKNVGSATVSADKQVVEMTVDYSGFTPSTFEIKKDIPVEWVIDGKQLSGCTNQIIIPDLDYKKKLNPGKNVIKFKPTSAGTINFSCWMGMVRGKFIVTN
ncbi:hypothetical protein COT97_05045 [Candidatus Falkowbacteria bacterium CG10_big_fil_rev_8_21_14_0_10_39_11]|uniref:HMA domain-containing protein n=1 Tax=Candidatus Falkowbacteria bacterium CG10_big_fil_rev_8_21_14_0_10_39_11 TaxID=1974565 RepID=A0A2H0V3U8_9BACT|nr:MAG: hypothetical protein COT97_05045 [Candidatus Falkowbacteria bacterium CG10_big_fil_rev_8_21_14_0_10_39_11]